MRVRHCEFRTEISWKIVNGYNSWYCTLVSLDCVRINDEFHISVAFLSLLCKCRLSLSPHANLLSQYVLKMYLHSTPIEHPGGPGLDRVEYCETEFYLTFTSHKTEEKLNHVFLFALFARSSPGRGAQVPGSKRGGLLK